MRKTQKQKIDLILIEEVKKNQKRIQKDSKKQPNGKEMRVKRIGKRRVVVRRLLSKAQKNLTFMLKNKESTVKFREWVEDSFSSTSHRRKRTIRLFPKALKSVLLGRTKGAARLSAIFKGSQPTDVYDAVWILASEQDRSREKMTSPTVIGMTLQTDRAFAGRSSARMIESPDVSQAKLEILIYNRESGTGTESFDVLEVYRCKYLDSVLRKLSSPRAAIKFIVNHHSNHSGTYDYNS